MGVCAFLGACSCFGLLVHAALAELKDLIMLLMQLICLLCLVFLNLILDVLTMLFVLDNHLILLYFMHLKSSLSEVQGGAVVLVLQG